MTNGQRWMPGSRESLEAHRGWCAARRCGRTPPSMDGLPLCALARNGEPTSQSCYRAWLRLDAGGGAPAPRDRRGGAE